MSRLSSTPRFLDAPLLSELEVRWRAQGAGIIDHLRRPGLTDDEMDKITEELGIYLPQEARVWWRWHDGAEVLTYAGKGANEIGPEQQIVSLAEAAQGCRFWRRVTEDEEPRRWQCTWLPINSGQDVTALECGGKFDDPVPVYVFMADASRPGDCPAVRSIGELVMLWTHAMDVGAWSYNRAERRWDSDWERLDPSVRATFLV